MNKKVFSICLLVIILVGLVVWGQVYTDKVVAEMLAKISTLETNIIDKNLDASMQNTTHLIEFWDKKESIICLFVDFKDIEQIGKQVDLVNSHLLNTDYELARVECNTLQKVVETFRDMIKIDLQTIF